MSCGLGHQKRQVRCEQKITAFTIATVADARCLATDPTDTEASTKPATEQPCYLNECPVRTPSRSRRRRRRRSAIIGEPTDFVLLSPRDVVNLEVGGSTATLIPDTIVRVFCPVRRKFRSDRVEWSRTVSGTGSRDDIGDRGRVKVTRTGTLRIRRSRSSDAGVYWCTVGTDSANLTLKFHSLDDALALAHERLRLAAAEGYHDVRLPSNFPISLFTEIYEAPIDTPTPEVHHRTRFVIIKTCTVEVTISKKRCIV